MVHGITGALAIVVMLFHAGFGYYIKIMRNKKPNFISLVYLYGQYGLCHML